VSTCFFRGPAIETTIKCLVVAMACTIPLSVTMTTGLSIAVILGCIFSLNKDKIRLGFKHPVSIAMLILLGLYVSSSLYTGASGIELQQSLRKMSRLLYFPLLLPLLTDGKWRIRALLVYIVTVLFSVIATLIISYSPTPVFKDSIFTSLFVAYAIFILSHFFIEYPRFKWLSAMLILFFSYYLFFENYGRTGQVLFFLLYLIFFMQRFATKVKYQIAAVLTLMFIAVSAVMLPTAFSTRYHIAKDELQHYIDRKDKIMPYTSSLGLRLMMVHNSWELIKQKPFFGWGAGSFKRAYAQFVPLENIDRREDRSNPHNQFILTWVELGIVGFLSLLYMFYTLICEFRCSKSLDSYLGFGLVCAIAVGCLANSWLLDFTSMFFFILFTAIFASADVNKNHIKY